MKIVVVGSGGREHAIVKFLLASKDVDEICVCPGNDGMVGVKTYPIAATDLDAMEVFCLKYRPNLVVVTPDDPLALGMVDRLTALGFCCFGPTKAAAEIESSKVFAKNLMKKYNIPTADYQVFDNAIEALEYIKTCKIPIVIKADGLALGKGVVVAMTRQEATLAVKQIMQDKKFGKSGNSIVVEEYLSGPEVSVLCFTDGQNIAPMVSSMDHKRIGENDTGLNTGGMGTIAPNPYFTTDILKECTDKIFLPTVQALTKENRTFKGCLYFGLMLTADGPKVIEYNCRFGDPETQVVLPLLKSDLLKIFLQVAQGKLNPADVVFDTDKAAACVVAASQGYPTEYKKGLTITLPPVDDKSEFLFCAGVKHDQNGQLVTNGGRVLGATAVAKDLKTAIDKAYKLMDKVLFENKYVRKDIGKSALSFLQKN